MIDVDRYEGKVMDGPAIKHRMMVDCGTDNAMT